MTWLLALGAAKRIGGSLLGFLGKLSIWQIALIAVGLFALVQHFELVSARSSAARWHKQFDSEHSARIADRKAYVQAQAAAKAKNEATVKRVEQEQQRISDETTRTLSDRLARIQRELRDNPSAKGSAGRTPIPESGQAPCRAYDPSWLCLSPADRLRAAENEQRHDSLIDWVAQQSEVDPNR